MTPIPANLITGFLGVGKTTAVLDLLRRKNPAERWAVLVNEYGTVSIDDAFIEGEMVDGVSVRSVAGGCFCCTTAPMLPVALHFLLQDMRPDRLLIETSGLGHPATLVDTLRTKYADRIELRATLGMITPSDFAAPGMIDSNPVFRDQVQLSDVLVLNKLDTATPKLITDFQRWANDLFPPKLLVAATEQGRLDERWLDIEPLPPEETGCGVREKVALAPLTSLPQGGGSPDARGFVFPPEAIFDEDCLLAALGRHPAITRLKGVFHCENNWLAVNRTESGTVVKPTAYRRDSRVEVFATGIDWETFEAELDGCKMQPGTQ
ncbi:MAG: GTP-binding protein [Fimbriiglobus sp.]|jgi:G3E family GTPase|nr:GTP-binding protein [Fimbriiglobus sp.]